MIKAICFDLDGVYFTDAGKKGFTKNLIGLSGDEEKVTQLLFKSAEMAKFVRGQILELEFWDHVRGYLNINLTDEQLRTLWAKEYVINQAVRDYVSEVKAKGYITCVCSNNNPARVNALEQKFQFLQDFDVKIFSYEVGETKPHKQIFEALAKAANVPAEEIVYADDNPDRLDGAKELGINTFVFENFEQFKQELHKLDPRI